MAKLSFLFGDLSRFRSARRAFEASGGRHRRVGADRRTRGGPYALPEVRLLIAHRQNRIDARIDGALGLVGCDPLLRLFFQHFVSVLVDDRINFRKQLGSLFLRVRLRQLQRAERGLGHSRRFSERTVEKGRPRVNLKVGCGEYVIELLHLAALCLDGDGIGTGPVARIEQLGLKGGGAGQPGQILAEFLAELLPV